MYDRIPGVEVHDHADGELVIRLGLQVHRIGALVVVDGCLDVKDIETLDPQGLHFGGGTGFPPLALGVVDIGDLYMAAVV